jgi:hypothetical protein
MWITGIEFEKTDAWLEKRGSAESGMLRVRRKVGPLALGANAE